MTVLVGWCLVTRRIGGGFNLSVSNRRRFFWVKKSNICWWQNSGWHRANRAVMLCEFGALKVKTQVQGQKNGRA
jgi:hypothetical protein